MHCLLTRPAGSGPRAPQHSQHFVRSIAQLTLLTGDGYLCQGCGHWYRGGGWRNRPGPRRPPGKAPSLPSGEPGPASWDEPGTGGGPAPANDPGDAYPADRNCSSGGLASRTERATHDTAPRPRMGAARRPSLFHVAISSLQTSEYTSPLLPPGTPPGGGPRAKRRRPTGPRHAESEGESEDANDEKVKGRKLSTTDLLVPASMKNAAKCDK